MKATKQTVRGQKKMDSQKLRYREAGKGFIVSQPGPGMIAGRRLVTAYADQFDRQYLQVDGSYERITEQHDYLSAD